MIVKNKKAVVVGLARSGLAAAILLDDLGSEVSVTDFADNDDIRQNVERLAQRDIKIEVGGHTQAFLEGAGLLVVSPGVPVNALPITWAQKNKVPVISEIELGYIFCKAPIIGITGTNGKTTTTGLIGHILEKAGKKAVVCGNIGEPFTRHAGYITKEHIVVLEVSSFQLEFINRFRPKVSIILNITQDHLDRYAGMDEYARTKERIFENQNKDDYLILNHDDPAAAGIAKRTRANILYFSREEEVSGAFSESGMIYTKTGKERRLICARQDIFLRGEHNVENSLAAIIACRIFKIDEDDIARALGDFKGFKHRFEFVRKIDGITFIDDSKSTTVDSTKKALESCASKVILIAGGRDKNSDFTVIRDLIKEKVRRVILIGEVADKIMKAFKGLTDMSQARSLREAVESAYETASGDDIVLLSPMCASFDMFKDYEERGGAFKESVLALNAEEIRT